MKDDVGGLEIAMGDALLVGGVERISDLARNRERITYQQRPALQPIGECGPLDQLEDERGYALGFL